ncbi:HNH endonuclease [Aeromonas tecta]
MFTSKIARLPYVKVHHVEMLKGKGEGIAENTVTLFKNCHRKHYYR